MTNSVEIPNVKIKAITLPLIGCGMAILRTPVPLSVENFDYLMELLGSMKKGLTVQEDEAKNGHQNNDG